MSGNRGWFWRWGWLLAVGVLVVVSQAKAARPDDADRILVWVAPVAVPGTQPANQPGELAWLDQNGTLLSLAAVPLQSNRVEACGRGAISPDGEHFVFFMGNDKGTQGGGLYLMSGSQAPLQIDTIQFLGCLGGNGRFQWSPDGERFAYIAYAADARTSTYAAGQLKIVRAEDASLETTLSEAITAFDFAEGGVVYTRFYTDQFGRADEMTVNFWDGQNERELITLLAGEGCEYVSSYIQASSAHYWLILGQRCGATQWQLYRIDPKDGNALLAITQTPRGAFTTFSETNNLIFSADQTQMLYSLPDGVTNNTVGLYRVPVDDFLLVQTVIERDAVMTTYGESKYAPPLFSPDGSKLAVVVAPPSGFASIQILDLTNLGNPPQVTTLERRDEVLPYMAFTPDGSRLIYIAGGEDNSIYALDLGSGQVQRIIRGTFSPWAQLSPDGDELAVLEWQLPELNKRDPEYLNLVVIDLETGERTLLLEGAVAEQDGETSYRFAVPFHWVR